MDIDERLEEIGNTIEFKIKTELCELLNKREAQGVELPFMDEVLRSVLRIKALFKPQGVCVDCVYFCPSDDGESLYCDSPSGNILKEFSTPYSIQEFGCTLFEDQTDE